MKSVFRSKTPFFFRFLLRRGSPRSVGFTLLLLLMPGLALATVLSDWPDWGNTKRKLDVHIRTGGAFETAVKAAITTWNTANAGNNWDLNQVNNASDANVSIGQGAVAPGNAGEASPSTKATGLFGWGSGELNSVNINVDAGLSDAERDRTIIHELGHCLRLDHTPGVNDVMNASNTATTPSAEDIKEAKASDEDPPCPFAAARNAVRGQSSNIDLVPKPESEIILDDVQEIFIESLTGSNFTAEAISWDPSGITVQFNVANSAAHNEVFAVTLVHADKTQDVFTGVLTVTDDEAPEGILPHAVAGNDITVPAGTPVIVDGRASFHDDPSIHISGTWLVVNEDTLDGTGLFGDYGQLDLPPGTYTAHLRVKDYYGRYSDDSITVTVEGVIPTVSEWGLIVLALLLLTAGTIVFGRRRRPAVA